MSKVSLSDRTLTEIVDHVRRNGFPAGRHLPAQVLADALRVSRAPINEALARLAKLGVVRREPNRGYFLARAADEIDARDLLPAAPEDEDEFYTTLVERCLSGTLANRVSETELMRAYDVPRAHVQRTLHRIQEEGWAARRPGGGWEFLPRIVSRERYESAYLFRAAIESQSLLQPTFRIDVEGFAEARLQQRQILDGGFEQWTRSTLFEMNCRFHEMLVACSGNEFFADALARVNRLRRLLEYRITLDRSRLPLQSKEHLLLLEIIEAGERERAAEFLRTHILGASAIKSPAVDRP